MLKIKKDIYLIIFFLLIFILIRSLHFVEVLNFSQDQGMVSLFALDTWQQGKITLIGPPVISIDWNGRMLFYGSIFYYFQLFFLFLGGLDPVRSSYIFTLFAALMLIPLYYSIKILINKKTAIFITTFYTLLPFYIDHTRFLWNPNFQLTLLPIGFLFLAKFKQTNKTVWLFLNGVWMGIILPLHYLLIVPILGQAVALLFFKVNLKSVLLYFLGIIVGSSPMILFELRNNFYNFNTIFLYFSHFNELIEKKKSESVLFTLHYYLTFSLFIFIWAAYLTRKKLTETLLTTLFLGLLIYCLILYLPPPTKGFGMPQNWTIRDEEKLYQLIKSNQPAGSFNVTHLGYNTMSWVSKYLLLRDNIKTTAEDYYNNQYLFVIDKNEEYMKNPAYEVNKFVPSISINNWKVNNYYNLYLLKKI